MFGLSGPLCRNTSSPLWLLENKFSDHAEELIQREQKPLAELRRKNCALPANQTIQIVFSSLRSVGGFCKCKLEPIFVFLNSSPQCSPCLWCKLLLVWCYWLVFRALWSAGALQTGQSRCLLGKCFIQLFLFAFLSSWLTVLVLQARIWKLSLKAFFYSLWHFTQGQWLQ